MSAVDVFESLFDDHSVFVLEWDDVGDGRYRDHREEKTENLTTFGVWSFRFGHHGVDEFEYDTCATESLEAVVWGCLGIDDGDAIRDDLSCMVMVGHDEVDALFAGIGCFGDGGDTVVHGDDEVYSFFFHGVNVFVLQPIAVVATMGKHDGDVFVVEVVGDESVECS